jgi:urate oxidase
MITLAENSYGKSRVRLAKVRRHPGHHDFCEWTIEILLEGDFESCFVAGDNSRILPTDTMKNTVYSLARTSRADGMEEFGKELAAFFLDRNPQVSAARVTLSEKSWQHLDLSGKPHPTTFVESSSECQTAAIAAARNAAPSVQAGLRDLIILKTANSAFMGFLKDSLTTLPETTDRLLATSLGARWTYSSASVPFRALRSRVRDILLGVFAAHASKSVQHTLYAMGESVLAGVPEIADIHLTMPNKHFLLADLSRFGQDNPNEIFVPIDEPHGTIEARLGRKG